MALLSILGMYNYRPDIFDGLTLPDASELNTVADLINPIPALDKNKLIGLMCMDLAELELVYADADTLKDMISLWSFIDRQNWLRLWETMLYKYNPIWNKDGTITEERSISREGEEGTTSTTTGTESRESSESGSKTGQIVDDGSGSHSETITDDGSSTDSRSTTTSESRDTTASGTSDNQRDHKVTGFDTDALAQDDQTLDAGTTSGTENITGSGSETVTGSGTTDNERTISGSETAGNTRDITESSGLTGTASAETASTTEGSGSHSETVTESYSRTEKGNIGVTTTQAMIREQREIVEFNLYHYIVNSFKQRFCIMIY